MRLVLLAIVVTCVSGCAARGGWVCLVEPPPECPLSPYDVRQYENRERVLAELSAEIDADFERGLEKWQFYESCRWNDLAVFLYIMAVRRAEAERDPVKRRRWVDLLVRGAVARDDYLVEQSLAFLLRFDREDFSEESLTALRTQPLEGPYVREWILVLGHIGITERRDELVRFAQLPPSSDDAEERWAALLALSRMGDDGALLEVIATVRAAPDPLTRAGGLFSDLAYTRRQDAFDALRGYLHSRERLPPLRGEGGGRLEAAYAAEQFARWAEGCPVLAQDAPEDDLALIRSWADAQTRWVLR